MSAEDGYGEMTIRLATQDDVTQIVRLVNAAYAKYLDRMEKASGADARGLCRR